MSLPRQRLEQASALAEYDRQKLSKNIAQIAFELPDGCNDCRYRSDDCAAGETVDIQNDALAFGNDRKGFDGREINQLIGRVDAVSWLVQQAVDCVQAIEDGKRPIVIDLEEKIEKTRMGIS